MTIIIFTVLSILFSWQANALSEDRLVLVQSISTSKKTFAIRYGAIDGIVPGQQSLFTSKAFSFQAKCIETNRSYSLWKVNDERVVVPFQRGEMVTFTNSLENMWSYLPKLFKDPAELPFKAKKKWSIDGSYTYSLGETASDAGADSISTRTGFSFGFKRLHHFSPHIEYSLGLRIDRDQALIESGNINTTTFRYMGTGSLHYYFNKKQYLKYRTYFGVEVGYGLSKTSIDSSVSSGSAMVLPLVKIGLLNKTSSQYTFYTEGSVESLRQSEKFTDDDQVQESTITATKITLGIRF